MISLVITLIIAFFYSICSSFFDRKGGMSLRQTQERNAKMCQFDALLHTFVCNKELNRVACDNLNKRIQKGELFWNPLNDILCSSSDDARGKICSMKECYFPDQIFGKELNDILQDMIDRGYPTYRKDLYVDSMILFSLFDDKYDMRDVANYDKIYREIAEKMDKDDPRIDIGSNFMLMETISENMDDFIKQLCNLINIDFEATFILYTKSDRTGHVMTIVKIRDGSYTFYDDTGRIPYNNIKGIVIMYVILHLLKKSNVTIVLLQTITNKCVSIYNISNKKRVSIWYEKHKDKFIKDIKPKLLYESYINDINLFEDDEFV